MKHLLSVTVQHRGQTENYCCLFPQQRTSQTRWAAATINTEVCAGESADIESSLPQTGIGLAIFFDGQQPLVAEREYVAGQRVALRIIDFNENETARLE